MHTVQFRPINIILVSKNLDVIYTYLTLLVCICYSIGEKSEKSGLVPFVDINDALQESVVYAVTRERFVIKIIDRIN